MRHEIFLKTFGEPKNIFLCSPFAILILKLRVSEHKISKLAIKDIQRKQGMLNKSHPPSRYKAIGGKNKKKYWCILNLLLGSLSLAMGRKIQICDNFSPSNLYRFESIFSGINWTNRLHNFDEGIYFPNNCCCGNQ